MRRGERAARGINAVRIDEARAPDDVLDAARGKGVGVVAGEARHVDIALALENPPVMALRGRGETVVAAVRARLGNLRGIPHDLLRHAADIHAGPAERPRLDER